MTQHARSFTRAAAFLPSATRNRVAVLYAFCRLLDDTVDEAPSEAEAASGLASLRREIVATTASTPDTSVTSRPIVRAFGAITAGSPLSVDAAMELIEGMRFDLESVRVSDDASLLRYCYRVAGTVGLMMCPVLGVEDLQALPFAIDLGIAMQLTNICRDVLEDAERGRVYIPETRLVRHGTSQGMLLAGNAPREAVSNVVLELLSIADLHYASGEAGMGYIPAIPRQAILVASRLYRSIGVKLRRRHGGDALHGRTMVGASQKLLQTGVGLMTGLRVAASARTSGQPRHSALLHASLQGLAGVNAG